MIASSTSAVIVAVPVTPLEHGVHNGTRTGPATPTAPTWMCAAIALPVSPLNVKRHDNCPVLPDFVSVAVNVPRALPTSPFGVGVSFAATMSASMRSVFAWLRAAAPPTAARENASASTPASKWNLPTSPPPIDGVALRPLLRGYEARAAPDCNHPAMVRGGLCLLATLLCLSGSSAFAGDGGWEQLQVRTIQIEYRTHDGDLRAAYVLVPDWYGPEQHPPLPLVISPHGRG